MGGREDRSGERLILGELVRRIGRGKLVVATLASEFAEERWEEYRRIFGVLGLRRIEHLTIERAEGHEDSSHGGRLDTADAVFFTGGDQLRITNRLGGTQAAGQIEAIFKRGGIIAGTSAGASVMGEMMLVGSVGEDMHRPGEVVQMVPGLGLIKNVIIDQHFSERGRIRRLLAAVAQNPRMIGLGIDEDTAIIVGGGDGFKVIGSGTVYVADGRELSYSNISEDARDRAMSAFGIKLHVLSRGDGFDLKSHEPSAGAKPSLR
ncbi:MAG TPA: cyanophycinase [Blastocatellia bacterium]|nr:cyanophycinase [Blastocatellia bacterium]